MVDNLHMAYLFEMNAPVGGTGTCKVSQPSDALTGLEGNDDTKPVR